MGAVLGGDAGVVRSWGTVRLVVVLAMLPLVLWGLFAEATWLRVLVVVLPLPLVITGLAIDRRAPRPRAHHDTGQPSVRPAGVNRWQRVLLLVAVACFVVVGIDDVADGNWSNAAISSAWATSSLLFWHLIGPGGTARSSKDVGGSRVR